MDTTAKYSLPFLARSSSASSTVSLTMPAGGGAGGYWLRSGGGGGSGVRACVRVAVEAGVFCIK